MRTVSLTIRDVPEDVLAGLRGRAIRSGRSIEAEVLAILEAAARLPAARLSAIEVLARVRALGLTTPQEAASMLRADRDQR